MKKGLKLSVRNGVSLISALSLLVVGILPALIGSGTAYAGEVTSRSVTMNQSTPGATGVTYTVNWTPASTSSIYYVVVDFCTHSPLPGDTTCTAPTGFSAGATTTWSEPNTSGNQLNGCTWTASAPATTTVELADSSGCAQTTSSPDIISMSNVTNPTTTCSSDSACEFYARIITYGSTGPGTYTAGDTTDSIDSGGVALSTASAISISATVEESINFCVYASGNTCGGSTSLTLGSGTPTVLTSGAPSYGTEEFDLSDNAATGVAIDAYGPTLTSGANTIPAQTSSAVLPTTGNSAGFGLYIAQECTTSLNPLSATTPYTYSSANPTTTPPDVLFTGTTSPVQIASTAGPDKNYCTSGVGYGAVSSVTTPSGVYTTNQQLIATGTF